MKPCIEIPRGWQRIVKCQTVVYISPSQDELKSKEDILHYLTSPGTCKCGLKCPLHLDTLFSFDANIKSKETSKRSSNYQDAKTKSVSLNKLQKVNPEFYDNDPVQSVNHSCGLKNVDEKLIKTKANIAKDQSANDIDSIKSPEFLIQNQHNDPLPPISIFKQVNSESVQNVIKKLFQKLELSTLNKAKSKDQGTKDTSKTISSHIYIGVDKLPPTTISHKDHERFDGKKFSPHDQLKDPEAPAPQVKQDKNNFNQNLPSYHQAPMPPSQMPPPHMHLQSHQLPANMQQVHQYHHLPPPHHIAIQQGHMPYGPAPLHPQLHGINATKSLNPMQHDPNIVTKQGVDKKRMKGKQDMPNNNFQIIQKNKNDTRVPMTMKAPQPQPIMMHGGIPVHPNFYQAQKQFYQNQMILRPGSGCNSAGYPMPAYSTRLVPNEPKPIKSAKQKNKKALPPAVSITQTKATKKGSTSVTQPVEGEGQHTSGDSNCLTSVDSILKTCSNPNLSKIPDIDEVQMEANSQKAMKSPLNHVPSHAILPQNVVPFQYFTPVSIVPSLSIVQSDPNKTKDHTNSKAKNQKEKWGSGLSPSEVDAKVQEILSSPQKPESASPVPPEKDQSPKKRKRQQSAPHMYDRYPGNPALRFQTGHGTNKSIKIAGKPDYSQPQPPPPPHQSAVPPAPNPQQQQQPHPGQVFIPMSVSGFHHPNGWQPYHLINQPQLLPQGYAIFHPNKPVQIELKKQNNESND